MSALGLSVKPPEKQEAKKQDICMFPIKKERQMSAHQTDILR